MSENKKMNLISKTIVGISFVLVLLLFSALVLTACDNASAEIDEAKAEEIALSDAGLKPEEVERMIIKADFDGGRKIYEVDFYTAGKEYEYDVDAKSGEILKSEREERKLRPQAEASASPSVAEDAPKSQNVDETPKVEDVKKADSSAPSTQAQGIISAEKAKEIAISHAGVPKDGVKRYRSERDRDDGIDVYEIEFWSGNVEYDYEIDAKTGKILKFDKDID